MHYRFKPVFLVFLAFSLCALPSCMPREKPKATQAKAPKAIDGGKAADYVENVALTRLTLARNPDGTAETATDIAEMKAYITKKKRKAEKVTLVIVDYTDKGGAKQVLASVNPAGKNFASLQAVMDRLGGSTLQNIRPAYSTVNPGAALTLPEAPEQLLSVLDKQSAAFVNASYPLSTLDDINLQLALIEFFTARRYQDAAYLTLDNTKRKLADLSSKKSLDDATLKSLSADLDALEARLKKELPYRL